MLKKMFRPSARFLSIISLFMIFFPLGVFAEEHLEKAGIPAAQEDKVPWTGTDVSIVGKYAAKYGRPPRDPYINTDQGDLLLFVFTLAGVMGGLVIGFYARKFFCENNPGELIKKED
ncbi:MAG: hypothetical protein ACUBOA_15535 [Candidatus Loosdrechtia sp.]|uniref:hypothetical protein n=1 Tax=Candidatus Loosdrechtia sp. TaxID=3101272 RepID=UPI003A70EDB7|nr:MAG: hypothetical protein QY305_10755 [Candidatus Jettenia sp. AMX2]